MITKTANYPFMVIEYTPDATVVQGTGAVIRDMGKKTVSQIVKENALLFFSPKKDERQKAIKLYSVSLLVNLIESVDRICSFMPGDIGRKMSGIYLKETIKGATTLELTFSKLTTEEANNSCFFKGATYRLWGGYNQAIGTKTVDCMFEGCVQNPTFSYEPAGVSVTFFLANHKYLKMAILATPFDIFNYYDSQFSDDPTTGINFPIRTVKDFLSAVGLYLDCSIRTGFTSDSDYGKNLKEIFGFFPPGEPEDSPGFKKAKACWGAIKQTFTAKYEDKITKKIFYPPIKEILDFIVGEFRLNWFMGSFGEIFFGIVPKLYDTARAIYTKGGKVKKLFAYRPFGYEMLSGFVDKAIYDPFESFDLVDIRNETPKEKSATGAITVDNPTDQTAEPSTLGQEELVTGVVSDSIADNFIAATSQINVYNSIYEQKKNTIVKTPLETFMDENMKFISEVQKTGDSEFFANCNMIGKISKALGDPNFSILDVFFFEGTNKHTGFYFASEVEHIWNFGSSYTMNITGIKPYEKEALPQNAKLQDTLFLVMQKTAENELYNAGQYTQDMPTTVIDPDAVIDQPTSIVKIEGNSPYNAAEEPGSNP